MNGITGPLDSADAWDIAAMLVKVKRAVDPRQWVDDLIAQAESDQLAGLY